MKLKWFLKSVWIDLSCRMIDFWYAITGPFVRAWWRFQVWKRRRNPELVELDAFRELVDIERKLKEYPNAKPLRERANELYKITGQIDKIKVGFSSLTKESAETQPDTGGRMSSFEVVVMDGGIFILPEELAFMLGDSRIVYLMPDVNEKSLILLQNVEMVKMMESWRRKMAGVDKNADTLTIATFATSTHRIHVKKDGGITLPRQLRDYAEIKDCAHLLYCNNRIKIYNCAK
jgi:DNA-binding transcriptional regulator/RsmH inhibitor MraZ